MSEAVAATAQLDFLLCRLLRETRVLVLSRALHCGHVFTTWTMTALASDMRCQVLDLLTYDLPLRRVASDTGSQSVATDDFAELFNCLRRYLQTVSGC